MSLIMMVAAIIVAVASLMAGRSAWESLQEAERRATDAWDKGTLAIQSEGEVRAAMGEMLLEIARGLRDVEIGDPEALSAMFERVGGAVADSAGDPSLDVPDVERADTLLREMAETSLSVGEIEAAQRLAALALDLSERRLVAAPSARATIGFARATSLIGRIALAREDEAAARRSLEKARALLAGVHREEPGDRTVQSALAETLSPLARLIDAEGDRAQALATAEEAATLWRKAVSLPRPLPDWQQGRARTLEELAEWRREAGEPAAAGRAADEAAEAWRAYAEMRPRSGRAAEGLARALLVQGRARLAAGDPAAARQALWESYSLQRGGEERPAEPPRTMVATLESLAEAGARDGDGAVAVQLLQDAAYLRRQELEREPSDQSELHLARTLTQLGDARAQTGVLGAALDAYEESLRLLEGLGAEESGEPELEAALAATWESIGRMRLEEGEAQGALGYLREALEIRRALAGSQPEDARYRLALTRALESLGEGNRATGENAQASEFYEEAVALRREFLSREPDSEMRRLDLARALMGLAGAELGRERLDAARPVVTEAAELAQRLYAAETASPALMREAAASIEQLGDLALAEGEAAQAAERYRQALAMREKLSEGDPARPDGPLALAAAHARIGDALRAAGESDEAAAAYAECVRPLRELVSADEPSARASRQLGLCLYKLAVVSEGDRRRSAQEEAEKVLEPLDDAGQLPEETAAELEELRASLSAS